MISERIDAIRYKLTRPLEVQCKPFRAEDYIMVHDAIVETTGLVAVTVALTLVDKLKSYRTQAPKAKVR